MSYSFGVYVGPYFYCGPKTSSSPKWFDVSMKFDAALFLVGDGLQIHNGSHICWASNRQTSENVGFFLDDQGRGENRLNVGGEEIERDKAIFFEQYRKAHNILTEMYGRPIEVCWGVLRHIS